MATAPLISYFMAESKGLATLPVSLVVIGTAISTIPASLFMRGAGRRAGFLLGAVLGALGGGCSIAAILQQNFPLFCLGALLFGLWAGFAQLYRFAAADAAPRDFRATAISLVLAGGVLAAFLGPESAKYGKDLLSSAQFLGSYIILVGMCLLSALVLILLDVPDLSVAERNEKQRPLLDIIAQPIFITATLTATLGEAVMNLLMTATPIAMVHAHHQFSDTALVVEWHTFGMFAPGFFTGGLIRRFGELRVIQAGIALQLICVFVAMQNQSVMTFWLATLLLGVGWNFIFTGGTALLTEAHSAAERAKAQGVANFLIFGVVAVGSLSSGALVHFFGWNTVNLVALPMLAVSVLTTLWYAANRRRHARATPELPARRKENIAT